MFLIPRFVIFLSNLYILLYVYLLDRNKCECSEDIRRQYIFYYSLFHIIVVVTFFLMPEFFINNNILGNSLKILLGLLLLINIYCLYSYSKLLEDRKCDCSDGLGRDFLKIFSYFYMVVLVCVFLYLILYLVEFKNDKNNQYKLNNNSFEGIVILKKINNKN